MKMNGFAPEYPQGSAHGKPLCQPQAWRAFSESRTLAVSNQPLARQMLLCGMHRPWSQLSLFFQPELGARM